MDLGKFVRFFKGDRDETRAHLDELERRKQEYEAKQAQHQSILQDFDKMLRGGKAT